MGHKLIIYIHILVALLMAIALYVGLKPLVNVPDKILIMDATLSGAILSGILVLLKNIIKNGYFSSLQIQQKLINYSSLAILFISCWLGLEFLVLYLFVSQEEWILLIDSIFIRIVVAILIYCISILVFFNLFQQDEETTLIEEDTSKEESLELSDMVNQENEATTEIIERIAIKNGQRIELIHISEIIHLQAEGDYVMVHSTKGKFLKEQTMKSLENGLPPEKFVRVHRSSIINVDFIAQIELFNKQTQLLKLKNGTQVKTSHTGYKLLKKTLGL